MVMTKMEIPIIGFKIMREIKCSDCERIRPYFAKDMCKPCYNHSIKDKYYKYVKIGYSNRPKKRGKYNKNER